MICCFALSDHCKLDIFVFELLVRQNKKCEDIFKDCEKWNYDEIFLPIFWHRPNDSLIFELCSIYRACTQSHAHISISKLTQPRTKAFIHTQLHDYIHTKGSNPYKLYINMHTAQTYMWRRTGSCVPITFIQLHWAAWSRKANTPTYSLMEEAAMRRNIM